MIVALALGRIAALAVFGLTTLCACHAAASAPTDSPAVADQRELDVWFKTVKLHKLARKVFGFGAERRDDSPVWLGPFRLTLQWRLAWKWNNAARLERLSPHGQRGGPVVAFDLPIEPWLSVAAQMASYRYVYARSLPERLLIAECEDPKRERRSLEAGLFLNVHFDGLL